MVPATNASGNETCKVKMSDIAALGISIPQPRLTIFKANADAGEKVSRIGISYEPTNNYNWRTMDTKLWLFVERKNSFKKKRFNHTPHYTRYGSNTAFWGGSQPQSPDDGPFKTYNTEFSFLMPDERNFRVPQPYENVIPTGFNILQFYWMPDLSRIPLEEDFPLSCLPYDQNRPSLPRSWRLYSPRFGSKSGKNRRLSLSFYFCFVIPNPDPSAPHNKLIGPPSRTITCRPVIRNFEGPAPDGTPAGGTPFRIIQGWKFHM